MPPHDGSSWTMSDQPDEMRRPMEPSSLGPRELDTETPNAARAYDYYLGGGHNFAHDRAFAEEIRTVLPCVDRVAQLNRAFLRRTVRYCLDAGINQFLDIGSGIPTTGNVHEIAQRADPGARVVYVDFDAMACTHAELMLADNSNADVIQADIRYPQAILDHSTARALLDFTQPVGLLLVGVLMFISDEDRPGELVESYLERCAAGSHVAISQLTDEDADPQIAAQVREMVRRYREIDETVYLRDRTEFTSWFSGLELVDPGITYLADWRPDAKVDLDEPARVLGYGGVGKISG
jgi:hypothetical protein